MPLRARPVPAFWAVQREPFWNQVPGSALTGLCGFREIYQPLWASHSLQNEDNHSHQAAHGGHATRQLCKAPTHPGHTEAPWYLRLVLLLGKALALLKPRLALPRGWDGDQGCSKGQGGRRAHGPSVCSGILFGMNRLLSWRVKSPRWAAHRM